MARYKKLTRVDYLVVHCAATPPDMDIGATEIDRWHRTERHFAMIGYHKVIRRNGKIESGRPLDAPGAHAVGFNERSLAVCLVGGVNKETLEAENNFTPEQFESLANVLRAWKQMYPDAQIVGHRDLPSKHARLKACPSFDVAEWLKENPLFNTESPRGCSLRSPY